MTTYSASLHTPVFFENASATATESERFRPSSVSAREQRAREKADRTINQFIEGFTEKCFFPLDCESLIFSLLPQLPEWPAVLQLKIVDEHGDAVATYLKGNNPSVIQNSISVVRDRFGEYATSTVNDEETLFQTIIDQLPQGSRLGMGGNFPNSSSTAGRIVTLRKELSELLKSEQANAFEALLADDDAMKCDLGFSRYNRLLPLWRRQTTERPAALNLLKAIYPEVPVERLNVLLERFPLSEAQEHDFLEDEELPVAFIEALDQSLEEWRKDRGLDGLFHTRTYNIDADVLARTFGQQVLRDRLGYELLIAEVGATGQYPRDLELSQTSILLLHSADGHYAVKNLNDDQVNRFNVGTDSFYRAIASVLQPHERTALGMQSETDVAGFRRILGDAAANASGGWFDSQSPLQAKVELFPDWLRDASSADKLMWNTALHNYRQALIEAQAPDLPDVSEYGDLEQLRVYAGNQLKYRLDLDLGLQLDPEEITVEITTSQWIGNQEVPPILDLDVYSPESGDDFEYTPTYRSLPQLCLENVLITDGDFWLTARFLDKNGRPIAALSRRYIHGLVRELDVGTSYTAFLKQRLLASSFGQWSRDQYAQVMDTQMRLDVIEAKMAKDFLDDGSLPSALADRGYKWVMAVLDRALDNATSAVVEGHRIQVWELKLSDSAPTNLHYYGPPGVYSPGQFDGLTLRGILMIAPESRQSVPSVVVYTPLAPDGVSFREYASEQEMLEKLFTNPLVADYLISRLPIEQKASLGEVFGTLIVDGHLKIVPTLLRTDNFYFASYEDEVQRVIAQIDAQTTSTGEANWQSAWNIASAFAELALEFTPFKVRLPIAAARSLYALSQGARAVGEQDSSAALHFVQAALLLTDGLPGVKKPKVKSVSSGGLKSAMALASIPQGMKLRTDGVYRGVYEKVNAANYLDFYAQNAGKTFAIRYDAQNATWRMIDPRRPDAYYQMPIRFDEQGQWSYDNIALRGGGNDNKPKVPKSRKGANASDTPAASSSVNIRPPGMKRARVDVKGFAETDAFAKAVKDTKVDKKTLEDAIEAAAEKYINDRAGSSHVLLGAFKGAVSIDLPGIGGSTGRGKWRLILQKSKIKDADGNSETVLIFHSVANTHRG